MNNEENIAATMRLVYSALKEKGYSPLAQIVGYLVSGDPSYITSTMELGRTSSGLAGTTCLKS